MERHARLRLSPNQLRSCPQCYSAMVLMAAEPDETETIAKLYECLACSQVIKVKHDEVVLGWISSGLRPPTL